MKENKFQENNSVFIKNKNRNISQERDPYVPEYQRLASSGKLPGFANEEELIKAQADLQARVRQESKTAPKIMVPNVGSRDVAWRPGVSTFYDEPLASQAMYDRNLVREDASIEQLEQESDDIAHGEIKPHQIKYNPRQQSQDANQNAFWNGVERSAESMKSAPSWMKAGVVINDEHYETYPAKAKPVPQPVTEKQSAQDKPKSLDQLKDNEIIVIIDGEVVFNSTSESEVSDFILQCLVSNKISFKNPPLVIKKMPIKLAVSLSI
jgi:hypothetical protein